MRIVPATPGHLVAWAEMREALWPFDTASEHAEQAEEDYFSGNPHYAAFIALDDAISAIGFAEATLRSDYVEACETTPVAFLEGIYVVPQARKSGVARALVAAVADWGRAQGCSEFASNALLDNIDSHNFHVAIGFEETERVVYFRKEL